MIMADLIKLAALLMLSAVFSGTEAAILAVPALVRYRISKEKNFISRLLTHLLEHSEQLIVTMLFLNLLVNTLAASLLTVIVNHLVFLFLPGMQNSAKILTGVIFAMTFLLLIFGEVTPKRIAIRYYLALLKIGTLFLLPLFYIFYPLSVILARFSRGFMHIFINASMNLSNVISAGDIKTMIKMGKESGIFRKAESDLLMKLALYSRDNVLSVMKPRQEIHGLNLDDLPSRLLDNICRLPYRNIPVFRGTRDNITGVISKKDILFRIKTEREKFNLEKLIRPVPAVPEKKPLLDLLKDMRENNFEFALVVDEFGGTEGFITYSAIVKKLCGKFESDNVRPDEIVNIAFNTWSVAPDTPIDRINEFFSSAITCPSAKSIGGYLTEISHNIPESGEEISDNWFVYLIQKSTRRGIKTLFLRKKS
ncbi:MAG: hypothetical protein A2096_05460 [Spirochaetes bacterium GWF1_41_5]|nr:MAG: hypothetical protein A2096_05460 [Spirochaetes bacterium GWF1_41_5]HBE01447.1 hypothetical protein [Spirochaetia bacterium]